MNDQELFHLCQRYGAMARDARNKFAGLLPEVLRRGLHRKKGFGSIYHFAAVLAGMSKKQVQRAIQLERKFEDKPALKKALVNGEVSINKLARVASIATKENHEALAEKVRILPQSALETFVRDEKQSGEPKPLFNSESVRAHTIELSDEVKEKLSELKDKGIDINELLLQLLKKRELDIAVEKEELSKEVCEDGRARSAYIKVKIKRLLKKEHGIKCSIKTCARDASVVHHTQRFALSRMHDPHYMAPLCKEHHQIAHSIDMKFWQKLRL